MKAKELFLNEPISQSQTNIPFGVAGLTGTNAIINGNFDFWQRGTSFPAPDSLYTADRWNNINGSSAVYTISRSTNVPTQAQSGVLSTYSLKVDVTTSDASPNFVLAPFYLLEGYDFRTLAQKPLTFSFWVYSSKTGVHCMTFFNFGSDRSIVKEYTVNAADTWEQKFVTLPASPSAGTWRYNTQVGLQIGFTIACSNATYQTTPDTWQTGLFYATSNQVNCVDNTANNFYVSQVKLETGSVATAFQIEPFDRELANCQRYYEKSFPLTTNPAQNAGRTGAFEPASTIAGAVSARQGYVFFKVSKKSDPSITFYNPSAANAFMRDQTSGTDASATSSQQESEGGFGILATGNVLWTAGATLSVHWTAEAEI